MNVGVLFDLGLRLVSSGDSERAEQKPGRTAKDLALILFACFLYVASKSMTTQGRVHIDQFEYWVLGTTPLLALFGYVLVIKRQSRRNNSTKVEEDIEARKFFWSWILA